MPWGSNIFPLLIVTASGGFTGLFVYSPAPGAGNLIASIAASAGTDPYGNAYVQGIATYGAAPAGGTASEIQLASIAGVLTERFASGAASELGATMFSNTVTNPNTVNEQIIFRQFGPQNSTNQDLIEIRWQDSTAATPLSAAQFLNYIDTAAAPHSVTIVQATGINIPLCSGITAVAPGTSGTTIAPETQHTPAFGAGWADTDATGTIAGLRYWLGVEQNNGLVYIQGVFHQTNVAPSGTVFTLPPGWRPGKNQFIPALNFTGAAGTGSVIEIDTPGNVNAPVPAPGNGNDCVVNAYFRLASS